MALDTPFAMEPTSGSLTYTATQIRRFVDALISTDGVVRTTDCAVTQRGGGANMTVDVAAGQVCITGSTIANQGTYVATSTATVNCAVTSNASGSTRTDLVVAQMHDDEVDSSGLQSWTPVVVTNPATGTGTPPATPANALPLATITVANGAASIVNGNIADVRTQACAIGTPYIQKGHFTATFASGIATATITFPKPFLTAPEVLLSCQAVTNNTTTVINDVGITATGFSYRAALASGGAYTGTVTGRYIALL